LIGWKVTRLGDTLFLTADIHGHLLPGLQYRILVKSPHGETKTFQMRNSDLALAASSFTAQVDLSELEDPPVLGFTADIWHGVVLDRTGWYFLVLREWTP
jgi:nitrogen fixation protein